MKNVRNKNNQKGCDKSNESLGIDSSNESNMITLKELRSCPGFEKIDDEEGCKIIESLYQLSLVAYEVINR